KAMERRGVQAVEVAETPHGGGRGDIELTGKIPLLGFDLGNQRGEKAEEVDGVLRALVQNLRAGCEIDRRGDRDGSNHRGMRRGFAEIFQSHISPETE